MPNALVPCRVGTLDLVFNQQLNPARMLILELPHCI
jgi:hypothetical protein